MPRVRIRRKPVATTSSGNLRAGCAPPVWRWRPMRPAGRTRRWKFRHFSDMMRTRLRRRGESFGPSQPWPTDFISSDFFMPNLKKISNLARAGQLLPAAAENLTAWLGSGLPAWAVASIDELIAQGAWGELNDRFYRYLEFGTGGMRGRTIGRVTTAAERGQAIGLEDGHPPDHAG